MVEAALMWFGRFPLSGTSHRKSSITLSEFIEFKVSLDIYMHTFFNVLSEIMLLHFKPPVNKKFEALIKIDGVAKI